MISQMVKRETQAKQTAVDDQLDVRLKQRRRQSMISQMVKRETQAKQMTVDDQSDGKT